LLAPEWAPAAPECVHGVVPYKTSVDPVTGEVSHAYVCLPCVVFDLFKRENQ